MSIGNFTPFRAKHVDGFKFGATAITEMYFTSTITSIPNAFTALCGTGTAILLDLVGTADTQNPTKSYAFAKDFSTSGNERSVSEEALLGADSAGSQNTEIAAGNNSKMSVECTVVYRNPKVTAIFNDSTKCCMITMDNDETSTTGDLTILFNNIVMEHVGSLSRNSDGLMEQKVKFSCRGGMAGSIINVTDTRTFIKYRLGLDYCEEIMTG